MSTPLEDAYALVRTPRPIDVIREQLAPTASDGELEFFAQVSKRLELDPFAGHIVLIGRYDTRASRVVHRPQITAEGRHVLAERTGDLVGLDGPEWTGPRRDDGTHVWVDVWDDDEPPHAARVLVHRKGWVAPANGTVRWKEFAQYDSRNKLLPTWARMPSHMLGKVAMSLALRRAFPGVVPTDIDPPDVTFYGPSDDGGSGVGERAVSAPDGNATESTTPASALLITDLQRLEIVELLVAKGVTDQTAQLKAAGEILGRPISRASQITFVDADVIIAELRGPDDHEAPDDEDPDLR